MWTPDRIEGLRGPSMQPSEHSLTRYSSITRRFSVADFIFDLAD